jgi:hypothetical protein
MDRTTYLRIICNYNKRLPALPLLVNEQAVAQISSPRWLRSKAGGRTEDFTAEDAEHAEGSSRIE